MLSLTSSFDFPANSNFVLIKVSGSTVRAAAGLRQIGLRFLGVQNSALSNGFIHARSKMQTKPFLPSTAVSKPWGPRATTAASRDIDAGAAVRANAISALRSVIRYWLSGAMFGYAVLVSSACAHHAPPSTTSSAKHAIALTGFRLIDFLLKISTVLFAWL